MNKTTTWADGFGTWHASVPVSDTEADVAWNVIARELMERGVLRRTLDIGMHVELVHYTNHGTAIYREAWSHDEDLTD